MYCKNCGEQISDDSKFCSCCGSEQSLKQVSDNQPNLSSKPQPNNKNLNISLSIKKPAFITRNKEVFDDKYDTTYKREIDATITGIIVLVCLSIIWVIALEWGEVFLITI